jgi:hypothetical protein
MQAIAETQATSNSKDDSNIMTAHNSSNASNSRNISEYRTANTVGMPAKAGMLLKSEMAAAVRDNSIIMDVISSRNARIDSREDNKIQHGGTPATVAGTRN